MKKNKAYLILLFRIITCSALLGLAACSSVSTNRYPTSRDGPPLGNVDVSKIPNAVPQVEPLSKYGNPRTYIVDGYRYHVLPTARGYDKVGYASWYGTKFQNQLTSTREKYSLYDMTAASTVLPLPTYVRVTNLANGRSVIVKVNDRGPFRSNRIMDLSYVAAKKLGYANKGTALVRVTAIDPVAWQREHSLHKPTYYAENRAKPIATYHPTQRYAENTTTEHLNRSEIYLQVGAFANHTTAAELAQRIASLTHAKVSIKPMYANNTTIYRVHLGPLIGNDEYEKVRQELAAHGYHQTMVVRG